LEQSFAPEINLRFQAAGNDCMGKLSNSGIALTHELEIS